MSDHDSPPTPPVLSRVGPASVERRPSDVAELATTLRSANRDGLTICVGRPALDASADVVLSLEHLTAPIDHCAGDLVATVPAGATLADVNAVLAHGGQWLPLDPPASGGRTIGAIVASNDSGPRRHRYGAPRDLIIGIEVVLADGRRVKAGGRVVKNVAGYDLARVMCGSFGSLAIITSATFKLSPLAPASRTLVVTGPHRSPLIELVHAIATRPWTPSALELESPPNRLMVRFETTPSAADRQAAAACDLCAQHGATGTIVAGDEEADLWGLYERRIWQESGTLLKAAVLPTEVSTTLDALSAAASARGVRFSAGGRAALGVLYFHLTGNADRHRDVLVQLRRAAVDRGGSVVVVKSDAAAPLDNVDRWGNIGDGWSLMRAVKAQFDPKGTLNPGAGPGGL